MGLLDGGAKEHGPACGAGRHDITVVTKDRQGVGGNGAGRDVKDTTSQFSRDFEHVGQHQQQALAGRKSRRQATRLQGAVNRTRRAPLRLQLHHSGDDSPKIGPCLSTPLIGKLSHRRGGCDGIDRHHLIAGVGYFGRGLIAVHDFLLHAPILTRRKNSRYDSGQFLKEQAWLAGFPQT